MAVETRLKSSRAVIVVLSALLAAAAFSSLAVYNHLSTELALEQQRSRDVINRQSNELGRFSSAWGNQLVRSRSVEPAGIAQPGVYRARIVEATAEGQITVDWLGCAPQGQATNDFAVTQELRPDVLADAFVLRVSGDGQSSQLVPYGPRDLTEAMERKTIAGQQMLDTEWWISVEEEGVYRLLVQAP